MTKEEKAAQIAAQTDARAERNGTTAAPIAVSADDTPDDIRDLDAERLNDETTAIAADLKRKVDAMPDLAETFAAHEKVSGELKEALTDAILSTMRVYGIAPKDQRNEGETIASATVKVIRATVADKFVPILSEKGYKTAAQLAGRIYSAQGLRIRAEGGGRKAANEGTKTVQLSEMAPSAVLAAIAGYLEQATPAMKAAIRAMVNAETVTA